MPSIWLISNFWHTFSFKSQWTNIYLIKYMYVHIYVTVCIAVYECNQLFNNFNSNSSLSVRRVHNEVVQCKPLEFPPHTASSSWYAAIRATEIFFKIQFTHFVSCLYFGPWFAMWASASGNQPRPIDYE